MDESMRKQVRAFNRMFAVKLRVFNRYVFGTSYSLVEGRVIGEIGRNIGCSANQIADTLDMDKSYLSRVIGKLQDDGLIEKTVSQNDNRMKHLSLTLKGGALFEDLEALSDAQAEEMMAGLSSAQIDEVIKSMDIIQSILGEEYG